MSTEYILQKHAEAAPVITALEAIAAHLEGSWKVKTDWPKDDYPPHWITIEEQDSDFSIMAEFGGYRHPDRFEFTLGSYPKYENVSGGHSTVTPRDLYHPDTPPAPTTTAAANRDPLAIARQVQRNVIEPGREIFARLKALAKERQEYTDKVRAAQDQLAAALGATIGRRSDQIVIYPQNIKGPSLRVGFRGLESIELSYVTVPEAIALLDRLREIRAKGAA